MGFWLVKTGMGASEVQQFPSGQKPLQANWGGAVYLGPTVSAAKANIPKAARQLGVPNPTHVPSLGTSAGILGSILGGNLLAGGAAVAGETATGAVAGDAAAGTAGGTAAAGRARPGGKIRTPGTGLEAGTALTAGLLWLFHPSAWLRAVELIVGFILVYFGLRSSFASFGRGKIIPYLPGRRFRMGRRAGRRHGSYQRGYREGSRSVNLA